MTIDRVEKGKNCRMETKRKIISALGYKLSDKDKIFPGNSSVKISITVRDYMLAYDAHLIWG